MFMVRLLARLQLGRSLGIKVFLQIQVLQMQLMARSPEWLGRLMAAALSGLICFGKSLPPLLARYGILINTRQA
jgi:hypothetical protein